MKIEYTYNDETMTLETLDTDANAAMTRIVDAMTNDPENVRVHFVEKGERYSGSYQDVIDLGNQQKIRYN